MVEQSITKSVKNMVANLVVGRKGVMDLREEGPLTWVGTGDACASKKFRSIRVFFGALAEKKVIELR